MLKIQSLVVLKQLKTIYKLNHILGVIIHKVSIENMIVFRYVLNVPRVPFYYRNDRERNGTFTEMYELYRKFINLSET